MATAMTMITLVINAGNIGTMGIFPFPSQGDLNSEDREMNPCPQEEAGFELKCSDFFIVFECSRMEWNPNV